MPRKPPVRAGDPPIRSFDYTINEKGCWVWKWSVERKGYASVRVNGRAQKAHRVSYELAKGPIPERAIIRHLCDDPACLNPDHLKVGTGSDNMRDMAASGNQGNQKLTIDEANEIRQIFARDDTSQADLARRYGVSSSAIRKIIYNERFVDSDYHPPHPRPNRRSRKVVGEKLAREIRKAYDAGGVSQHELARKYEVSASTVSKVIRHAIYPGITEDRPARRAANQKLTREQADEIRHIVESGVSQHQVAKKFGVSQSLISHIVAGKLHHDRRRTYPTKQLAKGESRPTLQALNGPAPTGRAEQRRRKETLRVPGRKPRRRPGEPAAITKRDWTLDPKTDCHNWNWGNKERRPFISTNSGKEMLAYRYAWESEKGPIPNGFQVNHKCNNWRCINLNHLYIGDQFHNMKDSVHAGNHATQKLAWNQVREIREKYSPGKTTYEKLAGEYDVTAGAIYRIITNRTFYDSTYIPRNPNLSVRRKLSEDDARSIRMKFGTQRNSASSLSREYSVSTSVIYGIVFNRTYHDPNYVPLLETKNPQLHLWDEGALRNIS